MENFKPYHKKEEVLIPSTQTIRFYEDENIIIFSSLELFRKYQEKRIEELSHIHQEKILLDAINEWFILNPQSVLDLKTFCQLNNIGYRFEFLFADLLQQEACIIMDKSTVQFITSIKMIEEGHQLVPLCGSGGRSFYVKDQLIHSTMDWIS